MAVPMQTIQELVGKVRTHLGDLISILDLIGWNTRFSILLHRNLFFRYLLQTNLQDCIYADHYSTTAVNSTFTSKFESIRLRVDGTSVKNYRYHVWYGADVVI